MSDWVPFADAVALVASKRALSREQAEMRLRAGIALGDVSSRDLRDVSPTRADAIPDLRALGDGLRASRK